jgi:hypothetical protein
MLSVPGTTVPFVRSFEVAGKKKGGTTAVSRRKIRVGRQLNGGTHPRAYATM